MGTDRRGSADVGVQTSFADFEMQTERPGQTCRARFLAELEEACPWGEWESLVAGVRRADAERRGVRSGMGRLRADNAVMPGMHMAQICLGFCDLACEERVWNHGAAPMPAGRGRPDPRGRPRRRARAAGAGRRASPRRSSRHSGSRRSGPGRTRRRASWPGPRPRDRQHRCISWRYAVGAAETATPASLFSSSSTIPYLRYFIM